MIGRPWTDRDLGILARAYGACQSLAGLAAALGRTPMAVRTMANRLGLKVDGGQRPWTAAEAERVKEAWGKVRTKDLARELGRSASAVKQKAEKLGLDSGRYLTPEEFDLVRELYPTHTAADIAERLYGSRRGALAVYKVAESLGLRKLARIEPELIERVRALHAEKLTDTAIAGELNLTREQVTHVRRTRLKLSANHDTIREIVRGNPAKQQATLGIRHGGDLRALGHRRYARANGWPEDLRPREVQILNVLADRGVPMTRLELSRAIGMRTDRIGGNGRPALLTGNGPGGTYTASLLRAGYLLKLRRAATGRGRGGSCDLYYLGPAALKILEERACQQTSQNAAP
jgi:hypothetical protein